MYNNFLDSHEPSQLGQLGSREKRRRQVIFHSRSGNRHDTCKNLLQSQLTDSNQIWNVFLEVMELFSLRVDCKLSINISPAKFYGPTGAMPMSLLQ